MKKKKVLVFGVFDGLHPGHHYFLQSASLLGEELIVVVARDSSVGTLKKKSSANKEDERLTKIKELACVSEAVLGDKQLGSYGVLKTYQPDLICLGYDQQILGGDLVDKMKEGKVPQISITYLEAHQPGEFHSSMLSDLDLS